MQKLNAHETMSSIDKENLQDLVIVCLINKVFISLLFRGYVNVRYIPSFSAYVRAWHLSMQTLPNNLQ